MQIFITTDARNKIETLMNEQPYNILRVGIKGGGCSGFNYHMEFVEVEKDNDIVMNIDGLLVVCDPKSVKYLEGMEIYLDTNLLNGGLKFRNPNAKKSCSCGKSFSI